MAVIKTQTISVDDGTFEKTIKCDKTGQFSADTPLTWQSALGIKTVEAKTLKELEIQWHDTARRYRESKTDSHKIIAYMIQNVEDISFGKGCGILVYAKVYLEKRTRIKSSPAQYHYNYEEVETKDNLPEILWYSQFREDPRRDDPKGNYRFLDWTQERHDFFIAVADAMGQLIEKLETLQDTKSIDALIASKTLLLMAAPTAVKQDMKE